MVKRLLRWQNFNLIEYQDSSGEGQTSGNDPSPRPKGLDHGALVGDAVDVLSDVTQAEII